MKYKSYRHTGGVGLLLDEQGSAEMLQTLSGGPSTPPVRSGLLTSPLWGFCCSRASWRVSTRDSFPWLQKVLLLPICTTFLCAGSAGPRTALFFLPGFLLKPLPAVSWCAKPLKLAPDCSVYCVPGKWQKATRAVSLQVNGKEEAVWDIRTENVRYGHNPEVSMPVH